MPCLEVECPARTLLVYFHATAPHPGDRTNPPDPPERDVTDITDRTGHAVDTSADEDNLIAQAVDAWDPNDWRPEAGDYDYPNEPLC